MTPKHYGIMLLGIVPVLAGCEKRVHILPKVQDIHRVAVVNLSDRTGKLSPESELFTNEFVSVGYSVVERGHLQEVIKEAFTKSGYLDEQSVAEYGRGWGIDGVVLHQILTNTPTAKNEGTFEITGWIRMVDVVTGEIVLSYNTEVRASGASDPTRAAKRYAEVVVDDIRAALKLKKVQPNPVSPAQGRSGKASGGGAPGS